MWLRHKALKVHLAQGTDMVDLTAEVLAPDADGIARAAELLRGGSLVAFPTETVYGLGADATNDRAVAEIYQAKGRPSFNPLIVHLPDLSSISEYAVLTPQARALAVAFWPGPLTLVLPLSDTSPISKLVTAGLDSVAIRIPAEPMARDLLRAVGRPIAAPSANPSGRISPTTAQHVIDGLGNRIAAIVNSGPCEVGVESTIIDATGALRLLRPGGLAVEEIESKVGTIDKGPIKPGRNPTAPGQLDSHYAPKAKVRLNVTEPLVDEAFLAFGPTQACTLNLSTSGDLVEAAANLFSMLHQLDADGRSIAVAPIPNTLVLQMYANFL